MARSRFTRRHFMQGSSAAVAIGAAASIGAPRVSWSQDRKIVRIRNDGDISVLDPGYMIGGAEIVTQFAVLPRLAVGKETTSGWTWEPSEFVDKLVQTDDLNIAFTLKPGLQWSKGFGELTAEDVKYSFERILTSDWKGSFPTIERVDVTDKYSGVIVMNKPFAPVWLVSFLSGVASIVCKAAVEKLPEKKFTTEMPAECGPYTLAEWRPQEVMIFKRNPDWPLEPASIEEVHLVLIKENETGKIAYDANEVDMTEITPASLQTVQQNLPEHSKLGIIAGPVFTWLGLNTEHEKLKDIRVRQAIQRAIDVDAILEAAYAGASPKATGIVPPGMIGHRESAAYSHNIDEAKALMAEAGVSGLELELTTLPLQDRIVAAQIIQTNLAEIGITVKIKEVDEGVFWDLGLEEKGEAWKSLEIWLMRYAMSPDPHDGIQWFVGEQVGVWNWERWKDPEFDKLFADGQVETDVGKRDQIYKRMQEIMENTGAYVWITHEPYIYLYRDSFVPAFDPAGNQDITRFKWA